MQPISKLIQHDRKPSEAVIHLLENTLIGTNGTLYQLLDTPAKIHQLVNPNFYSIQRGDKAIANMTICERTVHHTCQLSKGFYIRYLAFDSIFHGKAKRSRGQSSIHHYFNALFNTSNLNILSPEDHKALFWAYIDPDNHRSFNLNETFGFETIGKFKTKAFSRVNPTPFDVEQIHENDKDEALGYVRDFYKNFALFTTDHLFENNQFYVLKVDGEIVCGIQANPVHWRIKSLPGLKGKFLVKFAPFIPRLNKLINPKNHRFLATEGLFWKPGFENYVEQLLEGVLAKTNHHSLLIWTDHSNDQFDNLPIKWGFIQKNKVDNPINIVAKINGFTEEEKIQLIKQPKYLSGFDMT